MNQFVKKASSKIEKMSEEEIRRIIEMQSSELKIRNTVLDMLFDGCMLVDGTGSVLYMNETLRSLVPMPDIRKYQGQKFSRLISNSETAAFMRAFIKSGKESDSEVFEIDFPGEGTKSLNCSASRVKEPEGFLFSFRDVTFFKRFREEFRRNESLAQMTTMAAGVAHEIKNPLASISIYLQLMDKMMEKNGSMTREEAKKYLDVVSEEVDRINRIAVDFLFAVKPMKVDLSSISANDIVKKTMEVVGPELQEKGIRLDLNLATSLPKVLADVSLMQQALLNLVKNAMQAMPEDRKDPRITVSTYIDSDMVKLSVADNGCGMNEEQMSKIFEPYYTTKSSGTGLGLTVLFKIMKQHGGDVTVHSVRGEGSEFILQIPVPESERFRITDGGK
ncbi:MAG: ATP-binding protein [Spirochaetales bacterium]|nr:ATP-binding protein [Spirochaetales bacterium]